MCFLSAISKKGKINLGIFCSENSYSVKSHKFLLFLLLKPQTHEAQIPQPQLRMSRAHAESAKPILARCALVAKRQGGENGDTPSAL